jgi:hypothetical protein
MLLVGAPVHGSLALLLGLLGQPTCQRSWSRVRQRKQHDVRPRFAAFRPSERAQIVGALGLWSGLADRWVALQALAGASRTEAGGRRHVTRRNFETWLDSPESHGLHNFAPDGIYDGEWVSGTVIRGQAIRLLGGRVARPRQIVGVVEEALTAEANDEWALEAAAEFHAALALGELVATRADLPAATLADHTLNGEIGLPEHGILTTLRSAVTVDEPALRSGGIDPRRLQRLATPLGRRLAVDDAVHSVIASPLTRIRGNRFVLLAPSQLTAAALDLTVAAADRANARSTLLDQMRGSAEGRCDALLDRLGFQPEGRWKHGHAQFRFDSDKVAYVSIIVGAEAGGEWSAQTQLQNVADQLARAHAADTEVCLALAIVVSGAGNPAYEPSDDDRLLVIDLDELEVLADAHRGERLLLCQIASHETLSSLARRADIGFLDVVGHADRLFATGRIIVSTGPMFDAAEGVLETAIARSARHSAPGPSDSRPWVEVVRAADASDDFVFEEPSGHAERIALHVSIHDQRAWVYGPPGAPRHKPAGAIAYLAASCLSLVFSQAAFTGLSQGKRWVLEIAWDENQTESLRRRSYLGTGHEAFTQVSVGPVFLGELAQIDNVADRRITQAALAGWLEAGGADPETARTTASRAVDAVLPFGPGTLLVWPTKDATEMTRRIARAPIVSDAAYFLVRDRSV